MACASLLLHASLAEAHQAIPRQRVCRQQTPASGHRLPPRPRRAGHGPPAIASGAAHHGVEPPLAQPGAEDRLTLRRQRHRSEGHWRLGTALAGLLHDSGKAFDVTVTLPAVPAWNPLQEPLLAWLLAHQAHGTLPTPTVTWQPGRGMRHQTLGALAAALLLTPEDLVGLTLPVTRELWAFLGGDPDPANLFHQLLVRRAGPGSPTDAPAADGQSVRADLAAQPLPQRPLAAQVLATLAQCCQEGVLRVNQFPGQVFVQADATLVVVPMALDAVRQRLATRACACRATPCSSTTSPPPATCWGRRGRTS